MNTRLRKVLLVWSIACAGWGQTKAKVDSTFWYLSLPELQNYRTYYLQELQRLQEEKRTLIQRGIEDGERLLELQPDSKTVDQILIRLADLYYFKAKDDFFAAMETYEQQADADSVQEPVLDFTRALETYQRIIDEFPQSDLVDDAIYNQGFLQVEMGDPEKANQIFMHFVVTYPNSSYVPEAYIRLGEYYFNPPVNDIEKAIEYYKKVLEYKTSNRYNEALYKLGWSYYRLSAYPEAISYFTSLVEDLDTMGNLDPLGAQDRPDLSEESIEYIAICFMDFGGCESARQYLKELEDPPWGWNMLFSLGEKYMREREEYTDAIQTFRTLLDYNPLSTQAPAVQKRIGDCYYLLRDEANTFAERQKLFEDYQKESAWWQTVLDDKAKLDAYEMAEQALRDNIMYLTAKADEGNSPSLYEQSVDLAKRYLEAFPEDIYAYMIRWNLGLILDTKLHRYKEALQEYLTISMVYNNQKYERFAREKALTTIEDAAENAVVVADSLVRQERMLASAADDANQDLGRRTPKPLTTAESWLAMTYDNYIRLFPFQENTPAILANAGYLYYGHNQYVEALKYFKTLVKYFPESQQVKQIRFSILESYIGKGDFDSAELMAKSILQETDLPSEDKKTAESRLAEAIFYRAETFSESADDSMAANEFYRMALEVPTAEYADRALFNAGQGYDRMGAFGSAIRAYEKLRVSYANSSFIQDALNNLAFNYGEIGDYEKGARRYEELFRLLPEGDRARDVLYNAYVFYDKAENWGMACETGLIYAGKYPGMAESPRIFFRSGFYYEKLNQIEQARQVYANFPMRFPDSPVGVESYFRLGMNLFQGGDRNGSDLAFRDAVTFSESLKRRGLDENQFYAGEALFYLAGNIEDQYRRIVFNLPIDALNESIRQKQNLLQQLVSHYTQVAAYKTQRLPEAVYRIGAVYEEFAHSWANQELPVMDAVTLTARERDINARTTEMLGKAYNSYRRAIQVLDRIQSESLDEDSDPKENSKIDSLLALTGKWSDNSKGKVSEVLYQMAEINAHTIEKLLNAPIPADLTETARLEYRSQLLLRGVKPLLDVVIEAHRRNLLVGDSLGLSNNWIQASRSKILSTLNQLGSEYGNLSFDALAGFRNTMHLCKWTALNQQRPLTMDVVNEMVNYIELSRTYSQGSLLLRKEGIQRAQGIAIPKQEILSIQEMMIRYVFLLADSLDGLLAGNQRDQALLQQQFEKTGDPLIEELLAVFEDNVFFLAENQKVLLRNAFEAERSFSNPTPGSDWLAVRLVRLDPDQFAKEYQIPLEEMIVKPDTSWGYSTLSQHGWYRLGFRMIGWRYPPRPADSLAQKRTEYRLGIALPSIADTLYIRKKIDIPGYAVSGEIRFTSDVPGKLYLNEEPIPRGENQAYSLPNLQTGSNVIAMQFWGKARLSIHGVARVRYVPLGVFARKGGSKP